MSNTDTTPPTVTPEDRRLLMLELWGATLTRLLERLNGDEALTASFFDVVVGFLRDSGINADTVTEAKDALSDLDAEIARQIAEVTAEDMAAPPPAIVKAPEATAPPAGVVPLEQPFEVRTPRT